MRAVNGSQDCLSARKLAKRDDASETGILVASDIGEEDPSIVLSPPEYIGLNGVFARIGERYKGPRHGRALSAAAPGAGPFGRSRSLVEVVPARICASHACNRDAVEDIPRLSATGSETAQSRSRLVAARRKPWGRETPPWSCSPSQDDGGRSSQRHTLKTAPPSCTLDHAAQARCSTHPRCRFMSFHNPDRKPSTTR